ncbi:MAG TPA: type II toxin-antitoxin system RelE/ParE family toxin [Caulobacteraceae bacterium]|nr:type II toxin-antitoxin system RelE/ParE family toxin [Caulobacteraceae bacterium]
MKRRVRLTSPANRDLTRLIDYLDVRSPAAALRAFETLDAAIRSLDEFSERGRPGSEPGLRELIVRFGSGAYVVQYRVDAQEVVVARIFHGREDR